MTALGWAVLLQFLVTSGVAAAVIATDRETKAKRLR